MHSVAVPGCRSDAADGDADGAGDGAHADGSITNSRSAASPFAFDEDEGGPADVGADAQSEAASEAASDAPSDAAAAAGDGAGGGAAIRVVHVRPLSSAAAAAASNNKPELRAFATAMTYHASQQHFRDQRRDAQMNVIEG